MLGSHGRWQRLPGWVKLLLTGTRSANGYLLAFVLIMAGVRQGCPLAPPLYLAPAQPLFAYLNCAGFGVSSCVSWQAG